MPWCMSRMVQYTLTTFITISYFIENNVSTKAIECLQHQFGVEGRPRWSPEIEFFNAFIDYSATYERIQSEFEED